MVGRYHVYRAVFYALYESLFIFAASQRRVHLESPVLLHVLVAEHEIVRRGLAGHIDSARLRLPYQLNALLCRDVADVICAARLLRKAQVALDLLVFARARNAPVPVHSCVFAVVDISAEEQGVVLAVCGDYLAESFGGGHRLSHHFVILNAFSVVGECADLIRHALHIGELFAFFADGYRAVGQNFYRRAALYRVQLNLQMLRAVRHGVEVRHRADRRVSSVRRGGRAGSDGFFIRKTRLSEMHMNITKTGHNNISF